MFAGIVSRMSSKPKCTLHMPNVFRLVSRKCSQYHLLKWGLFRIILLPCSPLHPQTSAFQTVTLCAQNSFKLFIAMSELLGEGAGRGCSLLLPAASSSCAGPCPGLCWHSCSVAELQSPGPGATGRRTKAALHAHTRRTGRDNWPW